MFEKPETLWNCVTLATLSILTRSDHDDNGPDSINGTLVADANKTLHFGDLNKFDYPFRHYRGCAFESCSTFGGCPLQIAEFMAIPINTTRIGNLSDIMNGNYCASAHAGIDFDIAGPGVVIAYFFQFGLAFFFALSFTLTTDWMESGMPNLLIETGYARAVLSSIADLQETQAAFLITVASAAVATFLGNKGTGLANISTVISWITNDTILRGVVAAGSYPLLLIQLVLHASGTRWWYMLLFVIINFIMVFLTHLPKDMDPDSLLPHFQKAAVDLKGCGQHPGPRTFCQKYKQIALNPIKEPGQFFPFNSKYPFPVYYISVVLILDWAIHAIYPTLRNIPAANTLHLLIRRALKAARDIIERIGRRRTSFRKTAESRKGMRVNPQAIHRYLWALIELFTFALCILAVIEMSVFLGVLRKSSEGDLNITKWAFGQLVAVAVWFPIILKFFCLFILETGNRHSDLYRKMALRMQKGSGGRVIRSFVTTSIELARLSRFGPRSAQIGDEEETRGLVT
uniref:Uncharacterized protein n=2 Tax=Colletotrichum fructicola (strain Nara gc5) TaxID=1213859 RepID=L2G2U4_COLFN